MLCRAQMPCHVSAVFQQVSRQKCPDKCSDRPARSDQPSVLSSASCWAACSKTAKGKVEGCASGKALKTVLQGRKTLEAATARTKWKAALQGR